MRIPLEPGDEVAAMIRIADQFLVITRMGWMFEVWYEGLGQYRVQRL
jgi:hypothetical protein